MKIFNIITLIVVNSTIILYAQNSRTSQSNYLNTRVYGYVIYDGHDYLATEKGFLPVNSNQNSNEKWQDYYRKIYGDSTIVNPNTIIGENNSQFPIQFFMPLDVNAWTNKQYSFTDQMYLNNFMQIDSNGKYNYQPGVLGIIGSLKTSKGLKLPKIK